MSPTLRAGNSPSLRRRVMGGQHLVVAAAFLLLAAPTAFAQSPTPGGMPPPPGMSMATSAAMRFPQPVRVGDLLGRDVIQPVESQNYLGTVLQIVRNPDGTLAAVINLGGFLGFGSRPVSVPVNAIVLLGQVVEVDAFTPAQLRQLPTYSPGTTAPLSPDAIIKVGLAKPSH
jgi:PRC-barrel domain